MRAVAGPHARPATMRRAVETRPAAAIPIAAMINSPRKRRLNRLTSQNARLGLAFRSARRKHDRMALRRLPLVARTDRWLHSLPVPRAARSAHGRVLPDFARPRRGCVGAGVVCGCALACRDGGAPLSTDCAPRG